MSVEVIRPRYETDADRDAETQIITDWCARYRYDWQKMPGQYAHIDFALMRGDTVQAVAEVKNRPSWKAGYPDVFLGMTKVNDLYCCHITGMPALFVVRLGDGTIRHARIDGRCKDWVVTWTGNKQRNDGMGDIEPCYRIPIAAFRQMKQ